MNKPLTFEADFTLRRTVGRRLRLTPDAAPPGPPPGRVPRVARLMALAIHFDNLIRRGELKDYAEIARLGHVTRARVTQIMNLLNLAPDLQEALLDLPQIERGKDAVKLRDLQLIALAAEWSVQRKLAKSLNERLGDAHR